MKDKFINFMASEKEFSQLENVAKRTKMSKSDFIRHSIFSKEIVMIDGIKPLQKELKAIVNNLRCIFSNESTFDYIITFFKTAKSCFVL